MRTTAGRQRSTTGRTASVSPTWGTWEELQPRLADALGCVLSLPCSSLSRISHSWSRPTCMLHVACFTLHRLHAARCTLHAVQSNAPCEDSQKQVLLTRAAPGPSATAATLHKLMPVQHGRPMAAWAVKWLASGDSQTSEGTRCIAVLSCTVKLHAVLCAAHVACCHAHMHSLLALRLGTRLFATHHTNPCFLPTRSLFSLDPAAGARQCSCWRGTGSSATLRARSWQRCVHQLAELPSQRHAAAHSRSIASASVTSCPLHAVSRQPVDQLSSSCLPHSAALAAGSQGLARRGRLHPAHQAGGLLPGGLVGWCVGVHVWADSKCNKPSFLFEGQRLGSAADCVPFSLQLHAVGHAPAPCCMPCPSHLLPPRCSTPLVQYYSGTDLETPGGSMRGSFQVSCNTCVPLGWGMCLWFASCCMHTVVAAA